MHLNRFNDTESLDPKIAPLIKTICLQYDENEKHEQSILNDVKECEKALTMLLEKLKICN